MHEPVDPDKVHMYESGDGLGPDLESPRFDLRNNSKSQWNSLIIDNLLKEVQDQCLQEDWPVQRSDPYIREILAERYKRLQTRWQKGQPKITDDGTAETPAQTEAQLVAESELVLKLCRQTTRHRSKYARRATVLDHIIKLKVEAGEDDIDVWKWLQGVVQRLGEHGMSSEESDIENEVEQVLRVKRMDWCRGIERELDFLDLQRLVDVDVFAPQGSRPMKRIRESGNPATSRDAVKGLPRAFYNRAWITSLTQRQLEGLDIPEESFSWMQVAVATV
ncbi:hypothetical protein JVT61DRAFT_2534 [Boletus reticuloceps]|uniref:Uncharacterized protein n=1 Tax=Boletus reticuloceps TaxID=495285 RepID=A0A8I2YP30_9AGAM|nr:hypothetical protein JVT61DRAFT_2534 [Boletus reticuloceps]